MTPAQLHDAHAQGMSEREIDDQEAEDEAFQRVALQAQTPAPAQPHFLRCLDHRNEHMLAAGLPTTSALGSLTSLSVASMSNAPFFSI